MPDTTVYSPIIIAFIIAYPVSMLEYGYRKFKSNYLLLFRISFPFHIYGFTHGILAGFLFWILNKNGMLPEGEVASILNPITIGFGIKGLTNLNFYNIASTPNKNYSEQNQPVQIIPVGPKLIMDSIEKYCETLIENSHDYYLDRYIHKSINTSLKDKSKDQIINQMSKHLPYSLKKIFRITFMDEIEQSLTDNGGDPYFAMRLFVSQYGLSRYKQFISHL